MFNFLDCTDFYKTGHRQQMVPGTTHILENFTPRAGRIEGVIAVVFFGLQAHLKYDLTDLANRTFFSRPKVDVLSDYLELMESCLGPNDIGVEHIAALHDLQYLPLKYCALPEGTLVPYKIPMFTVENTHPGFAWVPGYLETLTSSRVWQACTSATTARRYRYLFERCAELTGGNKDFIDWQGHDFSFRGMGSPETAAMSGAGHLLSFKGTDTIPAIRLLRNVYDGWDIGGSVPATEHMVMCLGGKEDELTTFNRLLDLYPTGTVSVVSDTWDLWKVITEILPKLKPRIMARKGKLVIRPDSGDPVLILTGDDTAEKSSPAHKGVIELLWDIFGGIKNSSWYKELDSHIGAIYGDSITYGRAEEILRRLRNKGFASTNEVLGIGSYTYQYVTRDTHGFAMKATWARVNGQERKLSKDPITDSGMKKSACGRLVVVERLRGLQLIDNLSLEQESWYTHENLLQPVWENGRFLRRETLNEIRSRIKSNLWRG